MQWNRRCQSLEMTPVRQAPGTARTALELEQAGEGQGARGRTCRAWWGQLGVWLSGGGEQRRRGAGKGRVLARSPFGKSHMWGGQGSQAGMCVREDVPRLPCCPDSWVGGCVMEVQAGQLEAGVCTWMCSVQREPSNSSDVLVRSRVETWASQPGNKCEEGRPGMEGKGTENSYVSEVLYRDTGPGGQPENHGGRVCVSSVTDATKYRNLQPGEDTGKPGQHHPENRG